VNQAFGPSMGDFGCHFGGADYAELDLNNRVQIALLVHDAKLPGGPD
jgi:hypothetical protein